MNIVLNVSITSVLLICQLSHINNNTNTQDNVHGAVIITRSLTTLREFAGFI